MLYSKKAVDFLVNNIGLKRGSKENASIPQIIFSERKMMVSFLRGLFDTDGCIKFSKQNKQINYYPRIQIALRTSQLALQLREIFNLLQFPYGTWKENQFFHLQILMQ